MPHPGTHVPPVLSDQHPASHEGDGRDRESRTCCRNTVVTLIRHEVLKGTICIPRVKEKMKPDWEPQNLERIASIPLGLYQDNLLMAVSDLCSWQVQRSAIAMQDVM